MIRLIVLLALSALAATATVNLKPAFPPNSGWVARFTLAQDLHTLGRARRAAMMVLVLVAGLRLQNVDRAKVGKGGGAAVISPPLPDAAAMLEVARRG